MQIQALALDVHGTLAAPPAVAGPDSSPTAIQTLLEEHGVFISYQAWEAAWGMAFFIDYPRHGAESWSEFLAFAFNRLGEPLPPAARDAVMARFRSQPPSQLSPDGLRCLQTAKAHGLRTAAFTTIPRFRMAPLLAKVGDLLDLYFDGFAAGDAKGSRRYYERLAVQLGTPRGAVLCVGDEPFGDVEMPRRVGLQALLLDRSGRLTGEGVVRSLDDVARLIEREE